MTWHLSGTPYQVQLEALKRAKGHARYGYWLEQGLGKTPLVINEFIGGMVDDCQTAILISPHSFKADWALAPAEWRVPIIHTRVWPRDTMVHGSDRFPVFNIFNFEAIRSSGYDVARRLMDARPCVLIVDESSAIKNHTSKTAKAVLDLSKRAKYVRLLNGTPLVQNVMDLYPQLRCLGELDKVNPFVFKHRFAVLGGFMGKQVVGFRNENELHQILNRCSFRALKQDWADLPPKIYKSLHLEMTNKQAKHYKEMLQDFYTIINSVEVSANMVLAQLEKMRQIVSGLIIINGEGVLLEPAKSNPKIKAELEILNSGSGKLLIFYHYRAMGKAIHQAMRDFNPAWIHGGMLDLKAEKDRFNEDPACRVLVAQITTASRGHTFTAGFGDDRCSRVVYHDNTFSLLDRAQSEDRIHRGQQDQPCVYFDLIMSGIDEQIAKALQAKRSIAAAVVDAVRATAA